MVPNKSQFCSQVPNLISKYVEKSRFRSRSQDFCQILGGFGFGFEKFGLGKKVSVSVLGNFVSEEKYRFRFRKNLVSEKSLGFGKFGIVKKVSVSVSVKILVSSFSGA